MVGYKLLCLVVLMCGIMDTASGWVLPGRIIDYYIWSGPHGLDHRLLHLEWSTLVGPKITASGVVLTGGIID